MRDLRAAALRGTVWSAVQQVGDRGIRVPVYLVLARLLPPHAFGLIALAAAYIDFLQLIRNQGITAALIQREDLQPEHLDSAFWGNLLLGFLVGGLAFATAGPFAALAGQPDLEPIVRWLSIAFLLAALSSVQDALLRRELRFKSLAVRSIVGQAVAGVIAITAAFRGLEVWSLVILLLVYQAANVLLLWRACRWRPGRRFSWKRYRELLRFGIGMLGLTLVRFGRTRADHFIIGLGLGATPLGYYTIAQQAVVGLEALLAGTISPVLWSTLTRIQRERDRLLRAIRQAAEMLGLVTWPVFVGLAAVAPLAAPVVLGDRWTASGPVLAALALSAIATSVGSAPLTAIVAIGRTGRRVGAEIILAVVTLGAMLAVMTWGIEAVAWAYAVAVFAVTPIQLGIVRRVLQLDVRRYLTVFRTPAVGSLLMLGVLLIVSIGMGERLSMASRLVLLIAVGALVYLTYVKLAAPNLAHRVLGSLGTAFRASLGRPPAG